MAQEFISKTILANILETDQPVLIIDIRSADVYRLSKIIGALNVNLPATSILLRRIRNRTFEFTQLFSVEHKVVFFAYRQTRRIVLYDSNTSDLTEEGADVIEILFNSLRSMGFRVCCLKVIILASLSSIAFRLEKFKFLCFSKFSDKTVRPALRHTASSDRLHDSNPGLISLDLSSFYWYGSLFHISNLVHRQTSGGSIGQTGTESQEQTNS
ncbi:hypothetical protein CDAR_318171 [Caerostris darwini]|uniref:Rhodanese domain-containing protein n=1 Tax=Caerostris darwini TaxID=1538125 RepID=A0AAV4T5N7_9ARAC|nr:hypothetical protein CDAR_318171 [Caerostris darwini]